MNFYEAKSRMLCRPLELEVVYPLFWSTLTGKSSPATKRKKVYFKSCAAILECYGLCPGKPLEPEAAELYLHGTLLYPSYLTPLHGIANYYSCIHAALTKLISQGHSMTQSYCFYSALAPPWCLGLFLKIWGGSFTSGAAEQVQATVGSFWGK